MRWKEEIGGGIKTKAYRKATSESFSWKAKKGRRRSWKTKISGNRKKRGRRTLEGRKRRTWKDSPKERRRGIAINCIDRGYWWDDEIT